MTQGATGGRGSNPLACRWRLCFVFSGSHRFELCDRFSKLKHIGSNPIASVDIL